MILFIDDEPREMDSYIMELRFELPNYEVSFHDNVGAAWQFVEKNSEKIDLVVLDIMMSPGSLFETSETQDGLRTGVRFFEKLRKESPRLPIIIFTNVSEKRVEERFHSEPNCYFFTKESYLPFELAEQIKSILSNSTNQEEE